MTYDPQGNVTSSVANVGWTTAQYDVADRLVTTANATGARTDFTYDVGPAKSISSH